MKDFAFTLARDTSNTGPITMIPGVTAIIIDGIGGIIGIITIDAQFFSDHNF
jgi:hypothetical protein